MKIRDWMANPTKTIDMKEKEPQKETILKIKDDKKEFVRLKKLFETSMSSLSSTNKNKIDEAWKIIRQVNSHPYHNLYRIQDSLDLLLQHDILHIDPVV